MKTLICTSFSPKTELQGRILVKDLYKVPTKED